MGLVVLAVLVGAHVTATATFRISKHHRTSPYSTSKRELWMQQEQQRPQQRHGSASSASGDGAKERLSLSALQRQIFCNVELNGSNLEAVGFDMDFTLAQYNEAFDLLAFNGAKKKLVSNLGYPQAVLDVAYDSGAFRRGLIIDKSRGNILKVDRHRYVRRCMHGLRDLTSEERKKTYLQTVQSFTESNYVAIDTLFLLIDAILFANLVHLKNVSPPGSESAAFFASKSFEQIYRDIRHCVDMCHRDGEIKDAVIREPHKYIIYDAGMVRMLKRLRSSGKKVFLLTNSMWEYTQVVMDFLVNGATWGAGAGEQGGDGGNAGAAKEASPPPPPPLNWEDMFDVIVVGANKPGFLTEEFLNLFRVQRDTGVLQNVEDKDALSHEYLASCEGGKVFQGGHWQDLHRMLEISAGDRILYVGDHMYSDILRSKRTLGWRTCLIIPELENELHTAMVEAVAQQEIQRARRLQYDLDEYMDLLRQRIGLGVDAQQQLAEAEAKAVELKGNVRNLTETYNNKFNHNWGQLFKAGYQESRFAKQVSDYACLYTSRASNLGLVNPNRPFRPVIDVMPHDQAMMDSEFFS